MGERGRQRWRSATTIAVAAGLMTASVALLMTVPVRSPARGDEARTSEVRRQSALVDERCNELYREILANPQSMIGGFRASDAALDDFIGRARRAPPEVVEARKTLVLLKSEEWDVQTCVAYQRAGFTICEDAQATGDGEDGDDGSSVDGLSMGCLEWLDREVNYCLRCSTQGACGSR